MSELTIDEAYEKMRLRWSLPKDKEFMDLFLDVVPNSDGDLIVEAFRYFAYESKEKPYPGSFSSKFWALKHKKIQDEQVKEIEDRVVKGCSRCSSGRVFFQKMKTISRDRRIRYTDFGLCANCNRDASFNRYYLQIDDKIYQADKQIAKYLWIPTPNNRILTVHLMPLHSNALLEESFEEGMIPCPDEMIHTIRDVKIAFLVKLISSAVRKRIQKEAGDAPF